MPGWKLLSLFAILLAVNFSQQEEFLASRPSRPEKFTSEQQLQDYLSKMKAYAVQNLSRYGKRFSPPLIAKVQPEFYLNGRYNKQDLQNLYELFKLYNSN